MNTSLQQFPNSYMGIQCRQLTFQRYDDRLHPVTILDGIEAGFAAGRIALITGETGAGKSTLMHLLAGLLRPTSGEVVAGEGVVSRFTASHRDRWRRGVGIVFQDLQLMPDLSVLENVLLPAVPRIHQWPDLLRAARAALARTDSEDFSHCRASRLSGGQRQRVAIARALIGNPGYLFLDEPTAFQDDQHTSRLCVLWDRLVRRGACVLVCSHDPRLRQASVIKDRWELKDGHLERLP